ncbi:MAG: imidazole glycerol phosphate synthase subunit HisF [Desulfobacula sp.]|jgi:imidazole glycerol-phosphate synthase|uniref:imidazole glycerol phosphate synthase subunit HisF n=1 Tax=Desulfobacula sp. TaxID=2593537 RepID=UPI001E142DCE|nr:imidazole glycerol phosphate synthase subunit HisF [Desulfobacula sp.]MBT3485620.1 imidazole glycerol phosphate synthase subunit HisF [Desulfobacula sp.]MBT3805545.1 imidazole glycerol phosphate synthase subunit HisF [Desulfobacula sp.]MBT4024792.1 imidazole glycerol phosphate synthase subunit HisF [Desulfobacula sp.]MBT4200102.1 imidazole glycerol phosphate synthase subunit HisF [Desulfobacula sp.]
MITLLDYGAGNVRSVANAIEKLGGKIKFVTRPSDILDAQKLLFPGVGNYENMIKILHEKDYIHPLREYLKADKPFFGICLGMQALFEGSEEDLSGNESLGIFKGSVKQFRTKLAVPHIGWNGVNLRKDSPVFKGVAHDTKFYFVHSYHIVPANESVVLTTTTYDYEFVSSVQKGNIIGTQFHPEKSGNSGIKLLKNFIYQKDLKSRKKVNIKGTGFSKRIIACLDVRANDNGDLVVTKGDQYDVRQKGNVRNLGKPVELAGRYYKEGADEITFLNITGFRDFPLKDMPMIDVLEKTSRNVFVPLTIGGGIRDYTDNKGKSYTALEVAARYFRSGADKISIGSDAVYIAEEYIKTGKKSGKSSIEQISRIYGNQAVVISIDPKRVYVHSPCDAKKHHVIKTDFPGPDNEAYCWYQCTVQGGRITRDIDAVALAKACQDLGAGEILLNCIDKDGTNSGFDLELILAVKNAVLIPVIASSGAGCEDHFVEVFEKTNADAALAAGIFHRKEVPIQRVKDYLAKNKIEVR